MQSNKYASTFAVSQSAIKDFQFKSPREWRDIWVDRKVDLNKKEETFTMGSLIDTLLFSHDELEKRYYIGEERLPSKAVAHIVRNYYDAIVRRNNAEAEIGNQLPTGPNIMALDMSHEQFLLHAANSYCFKDGDDEKCGWQSTWKDETRLRSLVEKGSEYFKSLKLAAGRKVIAHEMNMEAFELRSILYSDVDVKDYFVANDDNDLLFQLEIYTTYTLKSGREIPIKGALDIVRINHKDKTVQIADFKSSYSAHNFIGSIKQFGYCDQLSFYDFLLREWLIEEGKYPSYTILPPVNIVIDIRDRVPYVYEYSWADIALAADGNGAFLYSLYQTHDHNSRVKRGWKKSLDEIGWHWENNLWLKPKELYENKKIKLNLLQC